MSDNQRLMAPAELRWSIGGLMLAGILSDTLGEIRPAAKQSTNHICIVYRLERG